MPFDKRVLLALVLAVLLQGSNGAQQGRSVSTSATLTEGQWSAVYSSIGRRVNETEFWTKIELAALTEFRIQVFKPCSVELGKDFYPNLVIVGPLQNGLNRTVPKFAGPRRLDTIFDARYGFAEHPGDLRLHAKFHEFTVECYHPVISIEFTPTVKGTYYFLVFDPDYLSAAEETYQVGIATGDENQIPCVFLGLDLVVYLLTSCIVNWDVYLWQGQSEGGMVMLLVIPIFVPICLVWYLRLFYARSPSTLAGMLLFVAGTFYGTTAVFNLIQLFIGVTLGRTDASILVTFVVILIHFIFAVPCFLFAFRDTERKQQSFLIWHRAFTGMLAVISLFIFNAAYLNALGLFVGPAFALLAAAIPPPISFLPVPSFKKQKAGEELKSSSEMTKPEKVKQNFNFNPDDSEDIARLEDPTNFVSKNADREKMFLQPHQDTVYEPLKPNSDAAQGGGFESSSGSGSFI